MHRRQFIGLAVTGTATLACPANAAPGDLTQALAQPRLLGIVRDPHVVNELGHRYRETVPGEDNQEILAQLLLAEASPDAASLPQQLDDCVQRDFAAARTVTLNGWILSVTEARQCALHSLLHA